MVADRRLPRRAYLGHPTMGIGRPVRRQGRFVSTTPEELNAWLGKESGKPVHVATDNTDLTAELKRGLSFVRDEKEASVRKAGRSKKTKRK